VEYEDRIRIATPEGVDLELTLAGVGSRFSSALVDLVIQVALVIAFAVLFLAGLDALGGGGLGAALFAILSFLLFTGYDVVFEVFASGRTPGKRLNGLRVVRSDGSPVGFLTSAVRNALRLVDILPAFYLVGIASILATARNQRLGDVAAGTLVVRERLGVTPRGPRASAATPAPPPPPPESAAWDVSSVTGDELAAVRSFLARRHELTPEARARLGQGLAGALRPKVAGVADTVQGETFLEQLAAAKQARGY
jgi:uncharacterized RDD family membrane protein YckC